MSCKFFDQFDHSPSREEIEKALIAIVLHARQAAMPGLKRSIKFRHIKFAGDIPDDEIELIFIMHTSDIMYAIQEYFLGDETILERVNDALHNPALFGCPDAELGDYYHCGFSYAIFWYGITGTEVNPDTCVLLNNTHALAIDEVLEEVNQELYGEKTQRQAATKKKLSRLQLAVLAGDACYRLYHRHNNLVKLNYQVKG